MRLGDANSLPAEARSSIESIGGKIAEVRRPTGGYSASQRWILTTASGRTLFAKIGTTAPSCENIRYEIGILERLELACMPRVLGWDRDSDHPFLLLEDLSSAFWPPPWNTQLIQEVLSTVEKIHSERAPLDDYSSRLGPVTGWWQQVARNHRGRVVVQRFRRVRLSL